MHSLTMIWRLAERRAGGRAGHIDY